MAPEPFGPIVLRLPPFLRATDELLLEISSLNDALRIERNAQETWNSCPLPSLKLEIKTSNRHQVG